MIIDAHAHIFPDKIAEKASEGISQFYDLHVEYNGMIETLLAQGEKAAIDRYIVQSVATVPHQVESINNFIAESVAKYPDKFTGFAAIHPDYEDVAGEIERIQKLGLKGLKLHPDFQHFQVDDEKAFPIYEAAEGKLPILFHVGDFRYDYSGPERLYRVHKRFPKLTIIGAHLAGWSEWERAEELFSDGSIYADLSSSLYAFTPERAEEIIRHLGTKRVMFGTDYPMWGAEEELARFNAMSFTEEEREDILCNNALRLLGEL